MKIIMNETHGGSLNGHVVQSFFKGEEYDIADSLANVFLSHGWAKVVGEAKMLTPVTENKAMEGAEDGKVSEVRQAGANDSAADEKADQEVTLKPTGRRGR